MIRISHTRAGCWRSCRRKYYWSYVRGLRSPATSPAMELGRVGHLVLQSYYLNMNEEKAMEVLEDPKNEIDEATYEHAYELLPRYFDACRSLDNFKVMATEKWFDLPLGGERGHRLIGIVDGLLQRNDGSMWLLEHKFSGRISTKHLDIDPQTSIYVLAAKSLEWDVKGVLFNIIRTGTGPTAKREPIVRAYAYRPPSSTNLMSEELLQQAREMQRFEDIEDPASQQRVAYRNPGQSCNWCPFYRVCLEYQDGGDVETMLQNGFIHRKEREAGK